MRASSSFVVGIVGVALLIAACSPTSSPASGALSAPISSTTPRLEPDSIAVTLSDGVRVRSRPEVSETSTKYEPLLPAGTSLFVLGGPVAGSGYDWYEVAAVTFSGLEAASGWVAAGSRDGVAWLEPGTVECPPVPADFTALAALTRGERLACFGGAPITVRARIVPCYCDIDAGAIQPEWFGFGNGQPLFLVEPTASTAPSDPRDWIILHLDPAGQHPDPLPVGELVEVTGMFDHPAARDCMLAMFDEPSRPTPACRFAFAVTSLAVAEH